MNPAAYRFTFATFPVGTESARCLTLLTCIEEMPEAIVADAIAIELFESPAGTTLLISVADSITAPTRLHCVFGVSNDPAEFDRLASFGLPIIEGDVQHTGTTVTVTAVAYGIRVGTGAAAPRQQPLLTVTGIPWRSDYAREPVGFAPVYRQMVTSPDVARPGSQVTGRSVDSVPPRRNTVRIDAPNVVISFSPLLYPDLFRLVTDGTAHAAIGWAGDTAAWEYVPPPSTQGFKAIGRSPIVRLERSGVFGPPAFVFDDVEIVGFRTELHDSRLLHELVAPLNFHHTQPDTGPVDFLYRPATATVIVELLRYGKMRARRPVPPLTEDDFMSQHELLVRILVGRVDDDTAQARDPALFVPAIFVDNPWSKALGRLLQGFPKLLAEFRAGDVPLDMTGRERTDAQRLCPFHAVTSVRLVTGAGASGDPTLLGVDCPDADTGSRRAFVRTPLPSVLMGTLLRRARFEQFDFDDVEFRRSFARQVIADQFHGFSSVQVSPVLAGVDLPRAWISGRCTLKDVEVAFPTGVATLRFGVPDGAPLPWRQLSALLSPAGREVGFPTGDWYRLRCAMELTVDDTLAW